MALSLVTGPDQEPLSLVEAKLHLRVDPDRLEDDDLIKLLITATRELVEAYVHRPLIAQTWDLSLDGSPCGPYLELPLPPVSAVSSITYIDVNGDPQTWSAALWDKVLPAGPKAEPARVFPIYGGFWPQTQDIPNAFTVRFVAGYGTEPSAVPASIRAAMKLLLGHLYEHREAVSVSNTVVQEIPLGIQALLWPFKAF